MHKEIRVKKYWVNYGYSFKRFALGFSISPWQMDIDLMFFWIGVEW